MLSVAVVPSDPLPAVPVRCPSERAAALEEAARAVEAMERVYVRVTPRMVAALLRRMAREEPPAA